MSEKDQPKTTVTERQGTQEYTNLNVAEELTNWTVLELANPELRTYAGSCHCGAVRFRVMANPERDEIADCNCSICRKKGFLHLIVPPEQFILLTGKEMLTTYTFNTGVAKHWFCRICGIHGFYRPRSHPQMIDVNLRCLDDDVRSEFRIVPFDGANWEANIDQLRNEN